jgi:hypothetical protein
MGEGTSEQWWEIDCAYLAAALALAGVTSELWWEIDTIACLCWMIYRKSQANYGGR